MFVKKRAKSFVTISHSHVGATGLVQALRYRLSIYIGTGRKARRTRGVRSRNRLPDFLWYICGLREADVL